MLIDDSQTQLQAQRFERVCSSPRQQPYRFIHKALRLLLAQAQHRAGALDAAVPQERELMVTEVERALSVCVDHLAHENRFFHEPLRERAPRAVAPFYADHLEHLKAIQALRLLLARVRDAGADAPALAYQLYLRFSAFVGENLEHMAEEETALTEALWEHFSDAEILGLEAALRATLSPEESEFYLGWMARGLNGTELEALLRGTKAAAPTEVFRQLLERVGAELDTTRWARLARAFGAAPVQGLVQS